MICKPAKLISALLVVSAVSGCNSSSEAPYQYASQSTYITAFSLEANSSVLANLDSVYFTIDQLNALIFNADSLPYGTRINALIPKITVETASAIEFSVPRPNLSDTIINYFENTTDSIDFSNGPVKMRVISLDGLAERTFKITVNVHRQMGDTLSWSRGAQANLPSKFQIPTTQHTAATASSIYCLTEYQGQYCMARATTPSDNWTSQIITFDFAPQIHSFNATDQSLYILDTAGGLHTSTDGLTWTATQSQFSNLYGNYGDELWGSALENGVWYRKSYPTGKKQPIEAGFPVSNTSQTLNYQFEYATKPQMMLTGGRLASGQASSATWGYDGNMWVNLSSKALPIALENPVVVPYFSLRLNQNRWSVNRQSVLLAMYGTCPDGTLNDSVFISNDFGITWTGAPEYMQLPKDIPARTLAQGFVYPEVLHERTFVRQSSLIDFQAFEMKPVPLGATFVSAPMSRATEPITQWDAPFIYVFGGENADGQTFNTLWRAVILRFTYKPLQ